MIGFPAAELVVENDRASGVCKDRKIFQVVMRDARPAMEDEQGFPATSGRCGHSLRTERLVHPHPRLTQLY